MILRRFAYYQTIIFATVRYTTTTRIIQLENYLMQLIVKIINEHEYKDHKYWKKIFPTLSSNEHNIHLPTLDGQTVMWGCEWYQPMTFKFSPLSWEKYLASSMAFTKSSDMISTRSFLISHRGGIDMAETETIVPVLLVIFYGKHWWTT